MTSTAVDPWLGPSFEEALGYALRVHGGQTRKGTAIPYVSHLLGVASAVLGDGGDEDQAIAALLHDAVEDQGGEDRRQDIHRRFGDRVGALVDACTEPLRRPKAPWPFRKHWYLDHLRSLKDEGALRVSLADKVHNAGSMVADHRGLDDELFRRFNAPKQCQRWYYEQLVGAFASSPLSSAMIVELQERVTALFPGPGHRERFEDLLRTSSTELSGLPMVPSANAIDDWDLALFFAGLDAGLVTLHAGGRFDTLDRPKQGGHWGLLSKAEEGGWYNAEYLPQLAAYVEAILLLGYPQDQVKFELPPDSLQLDLAIYDEAGRVVVLGEAKREAAMLDKLVASVQGRYGHAAPGPDSKKRGDEVRQLAWRLWEVRPTLLWLIDPGVRTAFRCSFEPLRLEPLDFLPEAKRLGWPGHTGTVLAQIPAGPA